MAAFTDTRSGLGASPIAADAPAGVDVRNEPDFEALEAEIRRMDAEGPAAIRWSFVVEASLAILSTRSKDLLVAVWAAYGLARLEGHAGLATGLALLEGLVGEHWEAMQPPLRRERGRVAALDWLFERLAGLVAERGAGSDDGPAIIAAATALDGLVEAVEARLSSGGLAAGDLVRALRPLAETARRTAAVASPPPSPAPPATAPAVPPAADGAVAVASTSTASSAAEPAAGGAPPRPAPSGGQVPAPTVPTSAAEAVAGFGGLETAMRQTAALLREADLADPRAYVLARTVAWLPVQQLPPHTDHVTMLNPPSAERLAGITAFVGAGQHREALALIEATLTSAIFWLDGQRLAVEAMTALGAPFLKAREASSGLVVAFVRRFPAVIDLCFASGEPFASPATRRWLEETAGLVAHTGGGGDGDGTVAALIAEARTLAEGGRARDGLGLLAESLRTTAVGRERFLIRLAQGQLGLDHDLAGVTLPLAEHLSEEVDARDLEAWEPDLAARASELWLKALAHPAAKALPVEAHRTASDRARRLLARTDAAAAARYLT